MKVQKLYMDTRPAEQPEATYPYSKNGIQSDQLASVFNEPGFRKMAAAVPYTLMGVIEADKKVVLFSTNNTDSTIGYFNPETELYEAIIDDTTTNLVNWPANGDRLGFNTDFYITGQAQRNYKGELVIAFTDKRPFPKYLNCDNPQIRSIDDTRLFPYFSPPVIDLDESLGGSLSAGTYYVQTNYERNDGTVSPRSEVSDGLTIAPDADGNTLTSKAVQITITKTDPNYDFIRVTVISKVDGKVNALQLTDLLPIAGGTVQLVYTGDNLGESITMQEVLTPPAVYNRIGTLGQLNDALYIGDLDIEPDYNDLQPYAAMVQLQFQSELIDATAPPEEHKSGKKKSLMHEEVYAVYVRYHKTRGGFTKAFHIPGLPGTAADLLPSTESSTAGESTSVPKFKVEDTIAAFDPATKKGNFGIYLNDTEKYPDTIDFDARSLGGPNLRGQSVRHHKVPSLRWCKQNLYSTVPEYGKTKLDLIGIIASNIQIPAKYTKFIDGYQILYAKRTPANMTIYGQGVVLNGLSRRDQASMPTSNADIYTMGGNWWGEVWQGTKGDYDDNWELTTLRQDTFRIHPFDVLLNKPAIQPNYISAQFRLRREDLRREGYLEDGSNTDGNRDMPQTFLVDYTMGITPGTISAGRQLRKVKNSFHLGMGLTVSRFNNVQHEHCFAGLLGGTNWPLNTGVCNFRINGQTFTEAAIVPDFEESYLVNLMALKTDVYQSFYSQRLVSAGDYRPLNDATPFWGGDTFNVDYTFHTYGRHDAIDTLGDGIRGIKVIRRIVCESASNVHLRYEIPGNIYSEWYPRVSVASNNPDQCYITNFQRSKEPNQFGYGKELNALNDFISSSIFNPYVEELTTFPYRVHRGGKMSRQNKPRSWRSFLPLDFYEMQKNMGRIINIEGLDDTLLIHMEGALFQTQDKTKLDASPLSITLGTADIFQYEPQEALGAKLGYAGTQHDLACVKTPMGYIFPDARLGELFLLKGKLQNLNDGVNTFLREYLKVKEKNVYTGNGITIGWDQKYKRILLTVKNKKPAPTVVAKTYSNTDAFFNSLVVGDIINYNGRYVKYMGLNNPLTTGFNCPADPPPVVLLGWRAKDVICEQDAPVTQVPHSVPGAFTGLSSPGGLLWTSAGLVWVADYDSAAGNFFTIDPSTGNKVYKPLVTTLYSIVVSVTDQRIYASDLTGGLKVLDAATGNIIAVPYGTDTVGSRKGLWIIGDTIVARDASSNTIVTIDKASLSVIAIKNVVDIPSGSTYLNTLFELLSVNDQIWVIPTQSNTTAIAVYNSDFTVLVDTITLPGIATIASLGGMYIQSGYFDKQYGKVYINDAGSKTYHMIDALTRTITFSPEFLFSSDTEAVFIRFVKDPINGSLYLVYSARQTGTGTIIDPRIYVLDRLNGDFIRVFYNQTIEGSLIQLGTTPVMWVVVPGNRSWEGGAWGTDGEIKKYEH